MSNRQFLWFSAGRDRTQGEFERLVEVDLDAEVAQASTSGHHVGQHVGPIIETANLERLPTLPGFSFRQLDQEEAARTVAPETWSPSRT